MHAITLSNDSANETQDTGNAILLYRMYENRYEQMDWHIAVKREELGEGKDRLADSNKI